MLLMHHLQIFELFVYEKFNFIFPNILHFYKTSSKVFQDFALKLFYYYFNVFTVPYIRKLFCELCKKIDELT